MVFPRSVPFRTPFKYAFLHLPIERVQSAPVFNSGKIEKRAQKAANDKMSYMEKGRVKKGKMKKKGKIITTRTAAIFNVEQAQVKTK